MHLGNLYAAVETVLTFAVGDELKLVFGELIVLGGLEILFLCNQFLLIKSLVLFVGTACATNLYLERKLLLTDAELLLFHGNHCVAQDVFLLGEFGL